jgi:hypothetical protein
VVELIHDTVAARWPGIATCVLPWATLAEQGMPRHPPIVSDVWDDV